MRDIEAVMRVYAEGREIMLESGNFTQWPPGYPPRGAIEEDIAAGKSYVCERGGKILAAFYFAVEEDETYASIDGAWQNPLPYGVVHRIARAKGEAAKGAGELCLRWCHARTGNTRIDTHGDNAPMRRLLERLGYAYCGKIRAWNGTERMAYQLAGEPARA